MRIMRKEIQVQRPYMEVDIRIYYRIITDFVFRLRTELTRCRIQYRRIIGCVVAQIDTNLGVKRLEPRAVIVKVMV